MTATFDRQRITFRLRRFYPVAREKVFRAWTSPDALRAWWCPTGWLPTDVHIDLRVEGTYRIGMRKNESSVHAAVYGRFLAVSIPERLVYTWQWENAFAGLAETIVRVAFVQSTTGTEIVLEHEGLPEADTCLRHRAGWIAALERMEEVCRESGW